MKKYLIASSIAILAFASIASAQNYTFSSDLYVGSRGNDVVQLQNWLISNGYDIPFISSGAIPKGYFGLQTKAALVRYQTSAGLPAFGFFGPLTRARWNNGGGGNNSAITVTSPNGNETWQKGTLQYITWTGSQTGVSNSVDIWLQPFIPPCAEPSQPVICMIAVRPPILIAQNVNLNTRSYPWTVGNVIVNGQISSADVSDGQYKIKICASNSNVCDSSDAYFSISSNLTNAGPLQIVSPNGGESWQKGTNRTITWMSPYYLRATYADLKLVPYYQACTGQICPMSAQSALYPYHVPYVITTNISINQNSYNWNVGTVQAFASTNSYPQSSLATLPPDGQYTIQICETGTNNCDSSNSPFTIYSNGSGTQQPVISGIDAPTTLAVGQTGIWTIHATDPLNGTLSYSILWGDEPNYYNTTNAAVASPQFTQTSTFSHAYNNPGTYTVTFSVSNSSGNRVQTSSTVQVGAFTSSLLRVCPTVKIINQMPTVAYNQSLPSSYFIYNNQRHELSEFDLNWVQSYCTVPQQMVY